MYEGWMYAGIVAAFALGLLSPSRWASVVAMLAAAVMAGLGYWGVTPPSVCQGSHLSTSTWWPVVVDRSPEWVATVLGALSTYAFWRRLFSEDHRQWPPRRFERLPLGAGFITVPCLVALALSARVVPPVLVHVFGQQTWEMSCDSRRPDGQVVSIGGLVEESEMCLPVAAGTKGFWMRTKELGKEPGFVYVANPTGTCAFERLPRQSAAR